MIFSKKKKAPCYLSGLLLRPALGFNFFPIFEQNNTFITINNKKNDSCRRQVLAVAFQYRDTELWKELTDSDVFAFRLSDGETGYCCVMGNAGEHLALGFYRGRKGFTTHSKTISSGNAHLSEIEMFEMTTTFDCINCDFMQASDMDVKTKKIIRNYADAHKLKIRRSKGWPDFTRHQPGKMQYGITCMEDARDIVEALRAAIAVAVKVTTSDFVRLGFDVNGNYPTAKGGKSVPYLIPNSDGTYEWNITQLPAFLPDECIAPKFANDILAGEMKKYALFPGHYK